MSVTRVSFDRNFAYVSDDEKTKVFYRKNRIFSVSSDVIADANRQEVKYRIVEEYHGEKSSIDR